MSKPAHRRDGGEVVDRLSRTAIAPEDLIAVMEDMDRIADGVDEPDFRVVLSAVTNASAGDADRAQALMYRYMALCDVVKAGEALPGWLKDKQSDGTVMTRKELIAAAAVEPLQFREGEIAFDRDALLARALSSLKAEGIA